MKQEPTALIGLVNELQAWSRRLGAVQYSLVSEASLAVFILTLFASVVFPIGEGILLALFGEGGWTLQEIVITVIIVGLHVACAIFANFGVYRLRAIAALADLPKLSQLDSLINETISRDRLSKRLNSQILAVKASLVILRALLLRQDQREAQHDVEALLEPLVEGRAEVLGFLDANAIYSLALYRFDSTTQTLRVIWRKCDDRLKPENRSWRPGQGHVGIAFSRNDPMIRADAFGETDSELAVSSDPRRDQTYYRSYIAIPITNPQFNAATGQVEEPLGVLAITSSVSGHFNSSYREFGRVYALILSTYFSLCHPEISYLR